MKRYLILILVLGTLLSACGKKEKSYADNIPCSELADTIEEQLPVDFGYETYGGEHLRYYFEDTKLPDDACLRYTVRSEDIGEFGIFHAPNAEARKEIEELCEEYLEDLREEKTAFIASYAPEEVPKLERAEVRSFGNYVTYAILSDNDRKLFFDTVEKKLVKG